MKLHSHISVFWGFSWISVISEFSFLGIELKMKTRISRKIFISQFFYSNFIKFAFLFVLSLFLLAEFVIPLCTCYFHDFRGFRDFRVFDLAFDECFLFHATTGIHYFLYKFVVTQRFGETATLLCSLKQVFWKRSAFYIRHFHNNIRMLLMPKVRNKVSSS